MRTRKAPEVIEVERGARWLVESCSSTPGAFWNVTYRLHSYERPAGRPLGTRYELRCPCPHGAKQVKLPLEARTPCGHLDAVVAFQIASQARPVMPANVAAMVD